MEKIYKILLLWLIVLTSALSELSAETNLLASNILNTIGPNINRVDANGQRYGVWVENLDSLVLLNYYNYSLLDGVCRSYIPTDDSKAILRDLWMFNRGVPVGPFVSFYPNGTVRWILVDLTFNRDFPIDRFSYQAYYKEYYEDGQLKAEGWKVIRNETMDWSENFRTLQEKWINLGEEIENGGERVGIWKFYNSDGTSYTKNYNKTSPPQE